MDLNEPECEPLGSARLNPPADTGCANIGPMSQFSATSGSLMDGNLKALMLFAEDSHASLSALPVPGSEKARIMTSISGLKCSVLFQSQSLLGYAVRMLLESNQWHSNKWYLTWKPAATKLHRRLKFRLVPSDTIIGGRASGFLHTPTKAANQAAPSMQKHPSCRGAIVTVEDWGKRMGFPQNWTPYTPTVMRLSQASRKSSAEQSC